MNPYQPPYLYGGFMPAMGGGMRPPPMGFPNPYGMPMGMMGGPMPMPMPVPVQMQGPIVQAPPKPMPMPIVKPVEQTTTVYVGKIPPTVEDEFIRKLLEFCGDVAFWRRVTDPTTGQLKGFAFCDFKSPEGVLRALRLLNGLDIDEHQLLLKVDDKNQKQLDAYIAKRNAEQHGITLKPGDTISQTPSALEKETEADALTKTQIDDLVGRVHRVLTARRAGKDPASEDIADGDPSKLDKAQLVSREIKNFRERQAQRDLEIKDRQRDEERGRHDNDRGHQSEFDRQKEIERLRLLRDKERERESRRRRDDPHKERDWEHTERMRERKRDENKKREQRLKDVRRAEIEDQEYDSDEKARKRLRTRDARKRREKEREEDELDRIKEREELEQKRRAEEERAKAEEQARVAQEAADAEKRRIDQQQQQRALLQQQQTQLQQQQQQQQKELHNKHSVASPDGPTSPSTEESTTLKLGFNKRTRIQPLAGFMADANDEEVVVKKKPLMMLDLPEHKDNKDAKGKSEVQSVIDRIPTTKEDLFKIDVDWSLIDKHKIIDKKMKPFVTKKIMEYLGEEEKTLIDFIMSKIVGHIPPEEILQQLALVLDDEAEMFVVKMWRMLVYEMYTASAK